MALAVVDKAAAGQAVECMPVGGSRRRLVTRWVAAEVDRAAALKADDPDTLAVQAWVEPVQEADEARSADRAEALAVPAAPVAAFPLAVDDPDQVLSAAQALLEAQVVTANLVAASAPPRDS